MSVDDCDCNPEFSVSDPVTEVNIKPGTKQIVEIIIYEVSLNSYPIFALSMMIFWYGIFELPRSYFTTPIDPYSQP